MKFLYTKTESFDEALAFGRKIRAERLKAKVTIMQLQSALNLTRTTSMLSRVERGLLLPSDKEAFFSLAMERIKILSK